MTTLIPAPAVSGLLPTSPPKARHHISQGHTLVSLQRTQTSLERHLQDLLDAQSSGLAAQVGHSPASDAAFELQPAISLSAARRGILDAIEELAAIKSRELDQVNLFAEETQSILDQSASWAQRRQNLQHALSNLDQSDQDAQINALAEQDVAMQEQINVTELKLNQLRAHQRSIRTHLNELKNRKASQSSSYQSSLAIIDTEVEQYLRRPLSEVLLDFGDASTLQSLPPKRRTLDMITEQAQQAHSFIEQRIDQLNVDIDALDDGGHVWQEAVETIEMFERRLRTAIQSLSPSPQGPSKNLQASPKEGDASRPGHILSQLSEVYAALEGRLQHAENKKWALLIAAVSLLASLFLSDN